MQDPNVDVNAYVAIKTACKFIQTNYTLQRDWWF